MLSLALLVRCGSPGVKSPVRGWICGVEVITVAVRMEPRNIWAVLKLPDPFSGSGPQVTLPKGLCVTV